MDTYMMTVWQINRQNYRNDCNHVQLIRDKYFIFIILSFFSLVVVYNVVITCTTSPSNNSAIQSERKWNSNMSLMENLHSNEFPASLERFPNTTPCHAVLHHELEHRCITGIHIHADDWHRVEWAYLEMPSSAFSHLHEPKCWKQRMLYPALSN